MQEYGPDWMRPVTAGIAHNQSRMHVRALLAAQLFMSPAVVAPLNIR
jgi:hypothetical protein